MKTKILTLMLFTCGMVYPQFGASSFYGKLVDSGVVYGVNSQTYYVVSSEYGDLTSTGSGDWLWFFVDLSPSIVVGYFNTSPTAEEIAEFPGTTKVTSLANDDALSVPKSFFKYDGNIVSYTGLKTQGFTFNYTDNATVGPFPQAFNTATSDTSAGTYTYGDYSGTFTGTITTNINASGYMYADDMGFGSNDKFVSRLNSSQNISISNEADPNAGSIEIFTSYYYGSGDFFPTFIATRTVLNVPFLSLNETSYTNLITIPMMLGTSSFDQNAFSVWPNPVKDVLTVSMDNNIPIKSIKIIDMNGRVVAQPVSTNRIDLSTLSSGIYFARIETGSGTAVKKIIKD